jgi:hypothetical protein
MLREIATGGRGSPYCASGAAGKFRPTPPVSPSLKYFRASGQTEADWFYATADRLCELPTRRQAGITWGRFPL